MSNPARTFQGITLTTDRPKCDNNQPSEGAGREKPFTRGEDKTHTNPEPIPLRSGYMLGLQ
jgi:hypothetical protein